MIGHTKNLQRPIKKYNIIYKIYIGDGDSKSYSVVSKSMPYCPSICIEKQECTTHITKCLGTGLGALIKSWKGQRLSYGRCIYTHFKIFMVQLYTVIKVIQKQCQKQLRQS